jgi:hypothetical protein
MDSFDNLYCRSVQYLQDSPFKTGLSVHAIGDVRSLKAVKRSTRISALMLILEEKQKIPEEAIEAGKAIPVVEAVELRPESLSDAIVSWVVFSHEANPSTLLIHRGVNPDEIKMMCYTRLMREVSKDRLDNEALKKVKELADTAVLTSPESLTGLTSKR